MANFPKSNFSAHSLSSSQTNVPGLSADSAQRIDEEKYRKIAKVPSVKGYGLERSIVFDVLG
jgi:hypothetical protein